MAKPAYSLAARTSDNPRSGIREIFTLVNEEAAQGKPVYKLVIVVPGALTGLLFANFTIEPNSRILNPTPGYPNYKMQAGLTWLEVEHYRLGIENDFQPNLAELDRLLSSDGAPIGAILINSPGNPTWAVFSEETVAGIARLAEKHEVRVISDEVYKNILLDDEVEHISPAKYAPDLTLLRDKKSNGHSTRSGLTAPNRRPRRALRG